MLTIYNLSSRFLELMAGASVRALCLAAVAGVILLLIRRRSASMQHAAWTAVLVSMLVLPVVSLVAPPLLVPSFPQLRLSKESPTPYRITAVRPIVIDFANQTMTNPRAARVSYKPTSLDVAAGLYLLVVIYFFVRLILGVALTNRIVRRGTTLRESEANAALEEVALQQSAKYPLPELMECADVTVPCVIGAERQAILLPTLWRSWDAWKLRAVWHTS